MRTPDRGDTPLFPGAGVGDVHAVVAGDQGGHGNDRRPTCDLLHYLVLPIVARTQVGLHDRADAVTASRLNSGATCIGVIVKRSAALYPVCLTPPLLT